MSRTNVLSFPVDRNVVSRSVARQECRGDKNSLRALSDRLLARVETAPPNFHKLFLLRLEIIVNEFEIDVEKYAVTD